MTEPQDKTQDTGIAKQGYVTQSSTPEAGPMAHVDPAAQQKVQDALNERIAREHKVPFKGPQIPPGLSPNALIALAVTGGLEIPPQTDKPEQQEEEEVLEPQGTGAKKK